MSAEEAEPEAEVVELADCERHTREARELFEQTLTYVTDAARGSEIHAVERSVFARLLGIGLALLKLFLAKRGTGRAEAVRVGGGPDAKIVPYHSEKSINYVSIFGKLRIPRAYFWSETSGEGEILLDARLNLPERCYSYVLQELAELFAVDVAYEKVTAKLEKVLRVKLWKRPIELFVREAGADVQAFYEQKAAPAPEKEGSILAVGLDGKGVPIRKDLEERKRKKDRPQQQKSDQEPPGAQAIEVSGDRQDKKRMMIVSAVYTTEAKQRTAEEIVRALVDKERTQDKRVDRNEPKNKRVRATFKGPGAAVAEVMRQVEQRDPGKKRTRVALVDGEKRLARRNEFAGWTLVLDIMHVLDYLWDAGNALLGSGTGTLDAKPWVRAQLLLILNGKVDAVIQTLRASIADMQLSSSRQEVIESVITYYTNNRDRMRYDDYLKRGLPIATGVVESACGVLVGERADKTRMRWIKPGAQSLLELRAVEQNGDWEEFSEWRIGAERERLYATPLKAVG